MREQQFFPCPPFECMGHLFPEQHILPLFGFAFCAIIGHLGVPTPCDIMAHCPFLQQPEQVVLVAFPVVF